MNELFGGVVYAGIDTDKHRYPIGKILVILHFTHCVFSLATSLQLILRGFLEKCQTVFHSMVCLSLFSSK